MRAKLLERDIIISCISKYKASLAASRTLQQILTWLNRLWTQKIYFVGENKRNDFYERQYKQLKTIVMNEVWPNIYDEWPNSRSGNAKSKDPSLECLTNDQEDIPVSMAIFKNCLETEHAFWIWKKVNGYWGNNMTRRKSNNMRKKHCRTNTRVGRIY